MKRFILILAVMLTFVNMGFSKKSLTGLGIYGNLVSSGSGSLGGGAGLTLKFGNFPVLGVEWFLAEKYSRIAASCDYWVVNEHLTGALDYYLGVGAYVGIGTSGENSAIDLGGRIPIGLQIWPVKNFEIFTEFAPLVSFLPSLGINFSLRLGFRIHF